MLRKLFCIAIALIALPLTAAEPDKPDLSKLQAALGGVTPDSVSPTPVPGLYEVVLGSQILYLSEDGRFAIQGDVIDLAAANNLTEARRGALRLKVIEAVGENNMVIFAPTGQVKHTVTIFTDIDCGYCRQLHREIEAYNQSGIKVRYLLYPRTGIGSDSYDKAVAVWCSADRQDALTRAKQGEEIERNSCPNPVEQHYQLGQMVGVRGTPSIVLESGEMIPGYVPAARLAQLLDNP